ncbi:tetratricopeptide repeat protein [Odoribacter lunatus]|uniref:tetratricopeptide repeat protein n=1 Tax=Odoribacter lunatus TaxID=2941335 RepID=UPI00203FA66C|nr:hypothetical protein [Odoribacter lunatus]
MYKIVFFILLLTVLAGCHEKHRVEEYLSDIERILPQNPDSAYLLLNKLNIGEMRTKKNRADYALLITEASFKTMRAVNSDSMIRIALNYYVHTDDFLKIAKINYYQGKITGLSDSIQKATHYLVTAEQYAQQANATKLLGLIYHELGSFYYEQYVTSKALYYFQKAEHEFISVQDTQNSNYQLASIAKCFLRMGQPDSSLYYYLTAQEKARQRGDMMFYTYVNQCLIPIYFDSHKYREAKDLIGQVYREKQNKFLYYYGLTDYYLHENRDDSARFYLNRILADTSFTLSLKQRLAVHYQLRKIAANNKNYKEAYEYALIVQKLSDSLNNKVRQDNITQVEEKYRNEQLLNQNYRLQIDSNRKTIWVLVLLFMVVLSIVFFVFITIRRKKILRQRQEQIDHYVAFIEELNQKYEENRNDFIGRLNESVEKEKELKKALVRRLQIIKQISDLLYQYGDNEKPDALFSRKVKELVNINTLTRHTLVDLVSIVNENYFGIMDYLKENHDLTKDELELCAFVSSGFSPQEISILYNIRVDNVYVRCNRLGKRMGLQKSLTVYIKEVLEYLKSESR